ncbi:diguanylate cyclase (GGDEF) domain-containing protein [Mariprofundus aestuarium]|uniref:diguanylate cyclase n=1 Tax=Mariprofundus aestuarium TaxID=1921086 RepID=A0A2K8L2Y5_MARES|nr:GGDEF domain-containing protein [Mariprofundus aestuarium]ATX79314.1 diguanylate cyclase (GGDEF) domain-containing protein [Mariprofundus aestuarium]
MSQIELLNQLLDDMDTVRPALLAAMPDDVTLRSTTSRMIVTLEQIRQAPGIPHDTYIWISQQFAKMLDTEHAPLLRLTSSGTISADARVAVETHVQQRRQLIMQAQQEIPTTHALLDSSCEMIGSKAQRGDSLQKCARHLQQLLQKHLKSNAGLRRELQKLVDAFTPSINAISDILAEAGEESPELKQARTLLEQELPDDVDQAKEMLQKAREGILTAGNKLSSASTKLQNTIQGQVEKLSALSRQLEQAESEARNDPLTGMANRRALAEYLKSLGQSRFSFLVIDIDHFKKINDTHGHDVGDEVLTQISQLLGVCARSSDLTARIGGEEFCIVFPDTGMEDSFRIAEILRHSIEMKSFKTSVGNIDITASFGIAEHEPGTDHASTFKAADEALYQSKHNGRNQVTKG